MEGSGSVQINYESGCGSRRPKKSQTLVNRFRTNFMYYTVLNNAFSATFSVSEDAGIEPRAVAKCVPNFSIPDRGSKVKKIPDPGSASKSLSILTHKIISIFSEIWSGMFIPDPDFDFFYPSRIPESKRHRIPDPHYWIVPVHHQFSSKYRNDFLIIISNLRLTVADATHVDARFRILSILQRFRYRTEVSGIGTLLTK